jgi:uncharacterized protein involved in outer membrane biogenesis
VALGLIVLGVVAIAWVNTGSHLRGPLIRYLEGRTGRRVRIEGPLKVQLFTWHPMVKASRVTIGNPSWSPPGDFAEIDELTAVFDVSLQRGTTLDSLELQGASFHLQRDIEGHANWHWQAPGILPGKGLPVIHALRAPDTRIELHDARRNLDFNGTLTTQNAATTEPPLAAGSPLKLAAQGQLNGHYVKVTLESDPLAGAEPDKPFHFSFDERSSDTHLTGHGIIPHPFNLALLDADYRVSGKDLKDLYFLVGVNLPDTGNYQLSGRLERRDLAFSLIDLVAVSGKSDVRCNLTSVLDSDGRAHADIDLDSNVLRVKDLGARAAGRAPPDPAATGSTQPQQSSAGRRPDQTATSFLDTPLPLSALRRTDYAVNLHIKRLETQKLTFSGVAGKMGVDHGSVTVPQLTGTLDDGKINARIRLDAKTDAPKVNLDLTLADLQLGQLPRKDPSQPPALEGLLRGKVALSGRGKSIRELAADASGTIGATIAQGTIRDSIAELAGVDLRGLRLTLTKSKKDTAIRCGVADFRAHRGVLRAQSLVLDTDPVLITGGGTIELKSQTLDLELEGHPKELRVMRLSAPISIRGPLSHPQLALEKGQRKFKLIDPGDAKDVDCGALLASDARQP